MSGKKGIKHRPDIERLINKTFFEPNCGCWLFIGHPTHNGYGLLMNPQGKVTTAHRVSWELHRGPIPEGMQVLHKCDIRCCVNPDHLFLGTNNDNIKDKVLKNRQSRLFGEKNPSVKLNRDKVLYIRKSEKSDRELSLKFNVSLSAIKSVKNGKTWSQLQ